MNIFVEYLQSNSFSDRNPLASGQTKKKTHPCFCFVQEKTEQLIQLFQVNRKLSTTIIITLLKMLYKIG